MAIMHLILQGKGGVGKSLIASYLYQYLSRLGLQVKGFDTDAVNHTFKGYAEFDVEQIDILKGNQIDVTVFDRLIEYPIEHDLDAFTHLVVDNGASTFLPLTAYLYDTQALSVLVDAGHRIALHTVITGGQALQDTITGLDTLLCNFPKDLPVIVWLNPKDGPIMLDGKEFEDFNIHENHPDRIDATIALPPFYEGFEMDLARHLARKQSFEAAQKSALSLLTRHRLNKYWSEVVECIDGMNLLAVLA